MYVRKLVKVENARRTACLGTLILGGCGVGFWPGSNGDTRSTLNLSAVDLDAEDTYYEAKPNHLFELAEFVEITDEPRVIRGRISDANDVDVYDLGPVFSGDRVVVTMAPDDSLDGAIAAFDETGTALLVNDHRNVYLGLVEPFVDVVIRRESSAFFVAVSTTPGYDSPGEYALVASRESPVDPPPPRGDEVLLVFDGGGQVKVGSRAPVDVPVFDAAGISPAYAGMTEELIEEIVHRVREDYTGLDVTILSTSEGDVFESGMTRIFFGTYDAALLGVAEGVDEFNATRSQEAIVFTDTFSAFMRLDPPMERMAQSVANVASHEIGHLLGMVHTGDPSGIMDVTASLGELMVDQSFARSPIYTAVFPLGLQDAVQYLLDAVGGDLASVPPKTYTAARRSPGLDDEAGRTPARKTFRLSSCSLGAH